MENNEIQTLEVTTDSFAKEIAKSFVLSAAATAGMLTGLVAVALVNERLNSRKKNQVQTETTTK